MSLRITNKTNFMDKSIVEIYNLLIRQAPKFTQLGIDEVKRAYTSTFTKNPIDTGESQKNTVAYTQAQLRPFPFIKIIFESRKETPFIYFAEPLQPKNPNFKYGKRNTVLSARDALSKKLGITK